MAASPAPEIIVTAPAEEVAASPAPESAAAAQAADSEVAASGAPESTAAAQAEKVLRQEKPWTGKSCFSNRALVKTILDERQITHLICARLKYDLYDFFRGRFWAF